MAFSTTNGLGESAFQITVPGDGEATSAYEAGKFWAPDAIFKLPVSGNAKLVHLNLCRRVRGKTGTAYAAQEWIAQDCGLSRRSVQRALRELLGVGAVQVRSRKAQGLMNLYCPTPPNLWKGGCASVTEGCASVTEGCASVTHNWKIMQEDNLDSLSPQESIPSLSTPPLHQSEPLPTPPQPVLDSPAPTEQDPCPPNPSLDLPLIEKSIETFYQNLGQPKISTQKIKAGVKTVADLKNQGFSLVDILFGLSWITTHPHQFKKPVYSLGLLPMVIGQALASRTSSQTPTTARPPYYPEDRQHLAAYHRQQERYRQEDRQRQANLQRQHECERLFQALALAEQTVLRETAVKGLLEQGVKPELLSDVLVRVEVYRLLGEGHQDRNFFAAPTTAPTHQAHADQSR